MAVLFWLSVAVVLYVYAGYPLILRLWARWRPRVVQPAAGRADARAGVSIVIAARNEGARLAARIGNLLALDYPADRRQIIVVSDGSTDDTADVVARFGSDVDLVQLAEGGKALALNAGVARARHDIIVFADARQVFAADALVELTAPFSDPQVGGVSGELLLDCESALFANRRAPLDRRREPAAPAGVGDRRSRSDRRRTILSTIGDGLGLYWRYEKELRRLESAIGSTLGATGAIYAMRRALWQPLPAETVLDDVLAPMRVVLSGARVVFTDRARAFDRAAADADTEARRKVRTLAGNYQILWLEPRLLLPWRNPVWLQYWSHKLGRLAVPYALLAIFATNIALFGQHVFYQLSLLAQVGFMLLAGYGAVLELNHRANILLGGDGSGAVRSDEPLAPVPAAAVSAAREVA
jgi:cellulose synthase/poly-beta-1,6-N-acetylglucosamine synthase-like glycosyltransferase